MTWDRLRTILTCAALAGVSGLTVCSSLFVMEAMKQMDVTSGHVNLEAAVIAASALHAINGDPDGDTPDKRMPIRDLLVAKANDQITGVRGDVRLLAGKTLDQVGAIAETAAGSLSAIERDANQQIADFRVDAFSYLTDTRRDLVAAVNVQLNPIQAHAVTLIDAYAAVPRTVGERLDTWTDCHANTNCMQGLATDFMVAGGAASRDFSRAAFTFNQDWPGIVSDAHGITSNVNRISHPHIYDRLLGYGVTGITTFRALHPAVNFVIQATQAVVTAKRKDQP